MTRHRSLRPIVAVVFACLAVAGLSPGAHGEDVSAPASRTVHDKVPRAILTKAAGGDRVPVIVRLAATDPRDSAEGSRGQLRAKGVVRDTTRAVLDGLGHRPTALKTSSMMPLMAFHATASELEALAEDPLVLSVVEDTLMSVAGTSTRGAPGGQQLPQRWDFKRVRAGVAHKEGATGEGQYVAVLDTGVDRTNPYLANDVDYEACFSTGASGIGECPNMTTQQAGIGTSAPCTYSPNCAHGTHVAHTAAGAFGVGAGAGIIGINVFHYENIDGQPTPLSFTSDQIWALDHVAKLKKDGGWPIAAVNLSLGGGKFGDYCDTGATTQDVGKWFDYLRTLKIVPVVATGNNDFKNGVGSPACFRSAFSVGNTTLSAGGKDAVFGNTGGGSNSAKPLDVLAPGTDICSAVPVSLDDDGTAEGWQCGWIGTSMAAPQVAGAVAVLRQVASNATAGQIEAAIKRSGVPVKDSRNGIVRKRLDVWAAIGELL